MTKRAHCYDKESEFDCRDAIRNTHQKMSLDLFWKKQSLEHINFMLDCNRDANDQVGIEVRLFSSIGATLSEHKTLIKMKELFLIQSIFGFDFGTACETKLGELCLESTMGKDERGRATFPYSVIIPCGVAEEVFRLLMFLDKARKPLQDWNDAYLKEQSTSRPPWYGLLRSMGGLMHIPGYEKDYEKLFQDLPMGIQKFLMQSSRTSGGNAMGVDFLRISTPIPGIKRILESP